MNFPGFTNTFSTMPSGFLTVLSASYKNMLVVLAAPNPSFLKIDKGIKLIETPESQRAFEKFKIPTKQGIVTLLRCLRFSGSLLDTMALHSLLRVIVPNFYSFFLLEISSFKNFTYLGI